MQYFGESDYSAMNTNVVRNTLKLSELEFKPQSVLGYFDGDENKKIRLFDQYDYSDSGILVCAKSLRDFARIEKIYNKIHQNLEVVDKSFWDLLKNIRLKAQNEFPAAQELFLISKKYSKYYFSVDLKNDYRGVTYGIESSNSLRENIKNQSFRFDFCHYSNDEVEELFKKESLSRKTAIRVATMFKILESSLFSRIINWHKEIFSYSREYIGYRSSVNTLNMSIIINGRDYFISRSIDSGFKLFAGKNHLVFEQ